MGYRRPVGVDAERYKVVTRWPRLKWTCECDRALFTRRRISARDINDNIATFPDFCYEGGYAPLFQKTTSPSCISYVLPFWLYLPAAFTSDSEPSSCKSVNAMISPQIKFFSKSLWITPAACGASVPFRIVHARASAGPAVKYRMSWSRVTSAKPDQLGRRASTHTQRLISSSHDLAQLTRPTDLL